MSFEDLREIRNRAAVRRVASLLRARGFSYECAHTKTYKWEPGSVEIDGQIIETEAVERCARCGHFLVPERDDR